VGWRADALTIATKATDLYRWLAETAPDDAHLPILAASLAILAILLSKARLHRMHSPRPPKPSPSVGGWSRRHPMSTRPTWPWR
jgi:hypothetical protein